MAGPQPPPQSPNPNQRDESKGRVSIITAVKTELAFFALVLLVTEGILGALAFRATGIDLTLLIIGMLMILIFVVLAVAFGDYKLRSTAQRRDRHDRQADVTPPDVRRTSEVFDEDLEKRLSQIRANVQKAARRNNKILTQEISNEVNELVIESADWSRGELHTPVQRYNSVLITLYRNSKESIFSTTIRDYLAEWPEELMEKMIVACESSQAHLVTRVFVFGSREEIDERAIQVLKRFAQCSKIKSLVFIDEDHVFNFPPDISRDFVVIDNGEEIGVTISYGQGNLRAVWYFGDENRKQRFRETCYGLENGSVPAAKILKWWNDRSEPIKGDA